MKKNITLGLGFVLILGGCNAEQPASKSVEKIETKQEVVDKKPSKEALPKEKKILLEPIAEVLKEVSLEEKIGSMLMVGFMGTTAGEESQICQDIRDYHLGGVILFDVNPLDKTQAKNFENKTQVKALTTQLQNCSHDHKLLIAVDQEGGRVQRLKTKYGFYGKFEKATDISKLSDDEVNKHYQKMAEELQSVGINYDLAPDVDLAINPKNRVIYQLGRSFGSTPKDVAHYSTIFIEAMRSHGILTSAKHFPGHGSSLGDTHKGFVDVTKLWQKKELEPYRILTQEGVLDTVMVAHVFNKKIDDKYPATLSKKTIKGLLRGELGFDGVTITDDLQMGAIAHKYGLKNTLKLAIAAGNDILLFGNQLSAKSMVSTKTLVTTIQSMVGEEVDTKDIDRSYERIQRIKDGLE